jgi:3-deoxy-D-manno-octulosonic-acid transferase
MIEALILSNTVDTGFTTYEEIDILQQQIKEPAVLFFDKSKNELVSAYFIDAKTKEELETMIEEKQFKTSSIPFGQFVKIDNRTFLGSGEV